MTEDDIRDRIDKLDKTAGSRPRCILFTHGPRTDVAGRLSGLTHGRATVDPGRHVWSPDGFTNTDEAKLGESPLFLTDPDHREAITGWWLAVRERANTPNWDIISQATIDGREGLILVEAKAHADELGREGNSAKRPENASRIAAAIDDACTGLNVCNAGTFAISSAAHYQLANRFAWAWRIACFGIPVALVYLGFTGVADRKSWKSIRDERHWRELMDAYGAGVLPADVWDKDIRVGGIPLIARLAAPHQPAPL